MEQLTKDYKRKERENVRERQNLRERILQRVELISVLFQNGSTERNSDKVKK